MLKIFAEGDLLIVMFLQAQKWKNKANFVSCVMGSN